MIKGLFFLSLIILSGSSYTYAADSITTNIVAPGIRHTHYSLSGPYSIDILEIDINSPYLIFESYKPNGLTKTSDQAAANDYPGHRVIGAINAGFFSFKTGWPVHNQVSNGVPVVGTKTAKSAFAVTAKNNVLVDAFSFAGFLIDENGTVLPINSCNTDRDSGKATVYTSFRGATTGTTAPGEEISVLPVGHPMVVNDTITVIVIRKDSADSAIPDSGFVISCSYNVSFDSVYRHIQIGDTVKLFLGYTSRGSDHLPNITELISGWGRLVKDGLPFPEFDGYDGSTKRFTDVRHPRTFVGINTDTTKVYFCTVDGRQSKSIGMTFKEMADFLLSIGVTNAVNLDGGGSTTMVVRGTVVNSPSDPDGERSVANSLQVISTAPVGTLHVLSITERNVRLLQGEQGQFHVTAKDEFLNPLPFASRVIWRSDSSIGSIDSNGLFTAGRKDDSGFVSVSAGPISDSTFVRIRSINTLQAYPPSLIMAPGDWIEMTFHGYSADGSSITIPNDEITLRATGNGMIVNSDGTLRATGRGTGTIVAMYGTISCAIPFSTIGNDTTTTVDDFQSLRNWSWKVLNTDPDNVSFGLITDSINPNSSVFKITTTAPAQARIFFTTDLLLSGEPDTLSLLIRSDADTLNIMLHVRDKGDEQFTVKPTEDFVGGSEWRLLRFPLSNAFSLSHGTILYPVTVEQIDVSFESTRTQEEQNRSVLYIGALNAHFSQQK